MIAGTTFKFGHPAVIEYACNRVRPGLIPISTIKELQAECHLGAAQCLCCDDGIVVVSLRSDGKALEMFVHLAVAFRPGAFQRQDAAMQAIARDLGAQQIAFRAGRPGWWRRLGSEWRQREVDEFVRPL